MNTYSVEKKMEAFENNLKYGITITGRPIPRMKLHERMEHYKVPGVSVALIHNGEVEWAKGYGFLQSGREDPVTPRTRFQAASISKFVAAAAVLKLVQNGQLDLDEDVNTYLRSWKIPENEFTSREKVTLRRILSHSAGLTVHGFMGYEAGQEIPTLPQILDGLAPANSAPVRVDILPGSMWRYSGGGTTIAQMLVSDITGRPFRDVVRELVLEPIGMNDSGYDQPLPTEFVGTAAVGHQTKGQILTGKWHTYPELAAAGLWTTPTDLAKFIIEMRSAILGKSQKVLNTSMAKEMARKQSERHGLGPFVYEEGDASWFGHGGSNEGYRCRVLVFPHTGDGIAVMTNGDNGDLLYRELIYSAADLYHWPTWQPIEKPLALIEKESLPPYTGKYFIREAMTEGILRLDSGRLYISIPEFSFENLELLPESEGHFYNLETMIELTLHRDNEEECIDILFDETTFHARKISETKSESLS